MVWVRVCADTPYTRSDGSGSCFCKYLENGIWYWEVNWTCFSRSIIRVEWYGSRVCADTPYIKTWNFRLTWMRFEICTLSDVIAQFWGHHRIGRPHNTLRPRGCELRACGWAVGRSRRHRFGVTEKSRNWPRGECTYSVNRVSYCTCVFSMFWQQFTAHFVLVTFWFRISGSICKIF